MASVRGIGIGIVALHGIGNFIGSIAVLLVASVIKLHCPVVQMRKHEISHLEVAGFNPTHSKNLTNSRLISAFSPYVFFSLVFAKHNFASV